MRCRRPWELQCRMPAAPRQRQRPLQSSALAASCLPAASSRPQPLPPLLLPVLTQRLRRRRRRRRMLRLPLPRARQGRPRWALRRSGAGAHLAPLHPCCRPPRSRRSRPAQAGRQSGRRQPRWRLQAAAPVRSLECQRAALRRRRRPAAAPPSRPPSMLRPTLAHTPATPRAALRAAEMAATAASGTGAAAPRSRTSAARPRRSGARRGASGTARSKRPRGAGTCARAWPTCPPT